MITEDQAVALLRAANPVPHPESTLPNLDAMAHLDESEQRSEEMIKTDPQPTGAKRRGWTVGLVAAVAVLVLGVATVFLTRVDNPFAASPTPVVATHAYSTCSRGAPAAVPSYDSGVRCPVPVMMMASERPAQPGRLTTSWITAARFGVRCSAPAAPTTVQAGGDHIAAAAVFGRDEMFIEAVVKAAALSAACARIVRVVTSDCASSAWNCTQALTIVAPCGMSTPVNRMPTVSCPGSRSPLTRSTTPAPVSSASSAPDETGRSSVVVQPTGIEAGSPGSLPASSSSPSRWPSRSRSLPMRAPLPSGTPVFAYKGESLDEYWDFTHRIFEFGSQGPNMILDDGGDATLLVHLGIKAEKDASVLARPQSEEQTALFKAIKKKLAAQPGWYSRVAKDIKGVTEETTTGVHRLYEMAKEGIDLKSVAWQRE